MIIDLASRAQLPEDVAAASLAPIAVSTYSYPSLPCAEKTVLFPLVHVCRDASRHLSLVSFPVLNVVVADGAVVSF